MNEVNDATIATARSRKWEYGSWVIINVILCTIPIIGAFVFYDITIGFSSLLAYCFTAIAVVAYFTVHYALTAGVTTSHEEIDIGKAKFFIICGFTFTVVAIAIFFPYSLHDGFNNMVNDWIFIAIPAIALLYLALTLWLAKPVIRIQAEEMEKMAKYHRVMRKKKETERWGEDVTEEIKEKGIQ